MDYRTVLVTLDSDAQAESRMRYAADLARQQGAHLLGIAMVGAGHLNADTDRDGRRLGRADLLEDAHERSRTFGRVMRRLEQTAFSSCVDAETDGTIAERLARHGRRCDLFVLGQSSQQTPTLRLDDAFVSEVFTQCGRPALILPPGGTEMPDAHRALVAWDGSREAVRAIGDAIPLLRRAAAVTLLNVHMRQDDGMSVGQMNEVVDWLSRHGVTAGTSRRTTVGGKVATLLAAAQEESSNLLVMGGYGRSRLIESTLGGVSREVLGRLAMPVLISH